jgi:hypothetical protein
VITTFAIPSLSLFVPVCFLGYPAVIMALGLKDFVEYVDYDKQSLYSEYMPT